MQHVHSRATDFGPSSPRTARPAARPLRTPWASRMLGPARPVSCNAPPTPRALRAARRARLREPDPCDDSPPRLPMRDTPLHSCPLPLGVRACTPPPGAASSPRAVPPAGPAGSPAASPIRRQRPAPCAPLMGGAGWADPLPAMRAALRDCGIRLTHRRVAGDGNCFLHALACAAGTTANERAKVSCTSLAELAVYLRQEIAAYFEDKAPLADCRDALEALPAPWRRPA